MLWKQAVGEHRGARLSSCIPWVPVLPRPWQPRRTGSVPGPGDKLYTSLLGRCGLGQSAEDFFLSLLLGCAVDMGSHAAGGILGLHFADLFKKKNRELEIEKPLGEEKIH